MRNRTRGGKARRRMCGGGGVIILASEKPVVPGTRFRERNPIA